MIAPCRRSRLCAAVVLAVALAAACDRGAEPGETASSLPACETHAPPPYRPSSLERERDEIFSLLAYSIALGDWQGRSRNRGLDIAAVLVDAKARPVCWGRNSIAAADNVIEHAELRMIRNYLDNVRGRRLPDGFSIYTTLEPCAMCAGAMVMARAARVVYGAPAGASGGVFERLFADSRSAGGACPYPYPIVWGGAPTPFREQLQRVHSSEGRESVHRARRKVHEAAKAALLAYAPKHPANHEVVDRARRFLEQVPNTYAGPSYRILCPPGGAAETGEVTTPPPPPPATEP